MEAISVFIPVYNAEKYVEKTITSVLNQTFSNWELIVLDDASVDQSYAICKAFEEKDKRIKVFRNAKNLGMVANWNKGISLCRTEYFIKLDADDLWHPAMLEESLKVMELFPEVSLLFTRYQTIDRHGEPIADGDMTLPEFAQGRPFSCIPLVQSGVNGMFQFSILRQGLSLVRRRVFEEVGEYRYLLTPETQASSDTEFYFRVGCNHKLYCIDAVYYFYRIHAESISRTDAMRNIQEKKMFELKIVINDYYYSQHKISMKEWRRNKADTLFDYTKYQSYQYRTKGQWLISVWLILKNLLRLPGKTIEFYWTRFKLRF